MKRKCIVNGCDKQGIGIINKCRRHGGGPRCSITGCDNSAKSKNKCKSHGGGRRCSIIGCDKSAQGTTGKCIGHGGGPRCSVIGCNKSARAKSNKCKSHGGGPRCSVIGCDKSAEGTTNKCIGHGGGPRCSVIGCTKSAKGTTNTCIVHGGGRRCSVIGCNKSAIAKGYKCKGHGGGRRCSISECNKSAQGTTNTCIAHGGGRRCPNCIDWPDSRSGDTKYDGYCATCFKRVFPQDPRSKIIYEHTKEIMVRNFINNNFEGFIHDKPLYTQNCNCAHRRRIDHRKLINNTILAIETDEFGHRSYDSKDEEIRYDDLYMIHSGKWIFIRFNPDGDKTVDIEDKLETLKQTMIEQINRIENDENIELLEIIKLYYN